MFRRPEEFLGCEEPVDHKGNKTAKEETGFGCVKVYFYKLDLMWINTR